MAEAEIHWEKVSQREVLNHKRMHLVEDEVVLPNGESTWYLLEVDKSDYATVIAERDGKIVMVYDYSYPEDQRLLQFPEGVIDKGETAEAAAKRELSEEAGLLAGTLSVLGSNLHNHRRSTARAQVITATNLAKTATNREATEAGMAVVLLTPEAINRRIATGEIVQKNTLAAWALWLAKQAVNGPA